MSDQATRRTFDEHIHESVKITDSQEASLVSGLQGKIDDRLAFLAAKNFAEADRIRDELLAQGIQLKDSKDPVTGGRVTGWEVKR